MRIVVKIYIYLSIFIMTVILAPYFVYANGWWGEGYKTSKWILKHGGTIIRYEIENISGNSDEYKIVMYDKKGRYVEVEYGTEGLLDDAKEGVYLIKADRGIKDLETYHGGRSFATIEVTAHPGETIKLKFDYKKKKVKMTTNYVEPALEKPIQKLPLNEGVDNSVSLTPMKIELKAEADQTDGQLKALELIDSSDNKIKTDDEESVMEKVENVVHPDALAMEMEKKSIVEKEKYSSNIFTKIWNAIKKLFGLGE